MNGQTLSKAFVPLPGKAAAVYTSSGLAYYRHPAWLGSSRFASTPGRAMHFDVAYAPFGETYAQSGSVDPAYTGQRDDTAQRQDTAGGLYDFPLREYSTQGRWPSPDPFGRAAACPKDPQTQNRYAYVRNNPLSYTDPLGALMNPFVDGDGGGGCDPFWDPFCGGGWGGWGFTGGGGGQGGPPPPHLPLSVIPPGFFPPLSTIFHFSTGEGIVCALCHAKCGLGSRVGLAFCTIAAIWNSNAAKNAGCVRLVAEGAKFCHAVCDAKWYCKTSDSPSLLPLF